MRLPNFPSFGLLSASPDGTQGQLDPCLQPGWIDVQKLLLEAFGCGFPEEAGLKHPLVKGPGRVVDLPHPRPVALLANQLAD